MAKLKGYQRRMVKEFAELVEKIEKLTMFLNNKEKVAKADPVSVEHMRKQLEYMTGYADEVNKRFEHEVGEKIRLKCKECDGSGECECEDCGCCETEI